MKILTRREQILPFVRDWVELLALDKYEEAFSWLYHPQNEVFTPSLLRQVIAGYGVIEPRRNRPVFRVTPLSSAIVEEGRSFYQDVDWFDIKERTPMAERVGMVHFDLPLNGEMSDLTAIFTVNASDDGYVLQLESIDVL